MLLIFTILSSQAQSSFENKSLATTPESVGMSSINLDRLDPFIKSYIDQKVLGGGAFLIARKVEVIYFKSFGNRSLDDKEPYKNDDIFRISSMTKAVTTTAILNPKWFGTLVPLQFLNLCRTRLVCCPKPLRRRYIMQLCENVKLGLDDPVHHNIPAFKGMAVLDKFNSEDSSYTTVSAEKQITIRHLLTNTPGIVYGDFMPENIKLMY